MLGRQNFYPTESGLGEVLHSLDSSESPGDFLARSEGYAEDFFRALGAEKVVAIDNSAYEGAAIVADMNAPLDPALRNQFSVIFDGGCLEHIFNFPQAIRNCMEAVEVGVYFLAATPANNYCGHGFYQFSPELFYRVFSAENGFATRAIMIKDGAAWYRVTDPAEARSRVELRNTRPTLLFVLAKKIADAPYLMKPPQQSDYVQRWNEADKPSLPVERMANGQRGGLRERIPLGLKEFCRPLLSNLPVGFRSVHYAKMKAQQVLSGEFCSK